MIDAMIVGQKIGVEALAGVGSTGAVSFVVIGFCTGLSGGFSIPVAQQFGAGNKQEMRRYVANSLWLCAVFSAVITVSVCCFCDGILRVMRTPEEIYTYARTYILIIFLGIPFTVFYNTLAGVLRAVGDSRTPVFCLMLSTLLNILLDFVFIMGFHMVVSGKTGLPRWACIFNTLPLMLPLAVTKLPAKGNIVGLVMYLGLLILI